MECRQGEAKVQSVLNKEREKSQVVLDMVRDDTRLKKK